MKKLSYYVAAFALCCGVSQTLTSCIEETEEPEEVKAMRQAEIDKLNADAKYKLAEARSKEAEAAIQEVNKAVKEGASAEEIAKTIAQYKSQAITYQKSNATALLPAELNSACPSYKAFINAQAEYLGGYNANGNYVGEGTKAAFEAAEEALNTSVDEIYAQAIYIAGKEADVTAKTNALNSTVKYESDYNKAYNDGTAVAKPADDLHSFASTTYQKDDADAATNKANSVVVFTYMKACAQADLDKATNALKLAKENKIGASAWTNGFDGVYDKYLSAKAENEAAEATYNDLKAKYEGELAALQSIN
jgi:hypothetical protein